MDKIMQRIELIKGNENTKIIVELLIMGFHIVLFTMMVLNLGYAWEAVYQTFKDYYLGKAVFLFLLSLALVQRVKIFNLVNIIFVIIYTFIVHKNMIVLIDSPELYDATVVKWACGGMMCVLLIDMIMYKKIAKFNERHLLGTILYLFVTIFAFVYTNGGFYTYLLLFPFLNLLLLRVEKERLQKWILSLTYGYYAAFLYTMIKSFTLVPYTGERYYGIYINHGIFGIFIGGAFVCSLWWFLLLIKRNAPMWQRLLMIVPIGFVLVCNLMNGARVAELGVIVVGFSAICIWGGKQNKKQFLFRIAQISILACILIVVLFGALYILNRYDRETLELIIENDVLREKILYWHNRARTLFNEESRTGIFEAGSFLNAMDRFSSSRLSHWISYLKLVDFAPETTFCIEVNDYTFAHPHNIYIYWLYHLGIIPGIGMIIWIVSYLIQAIRRTIGKDNMCMLSLLWVIYFMVIGINEDPVWVIPVGFITILLYYPLVVKYRDAKEKKEEKNG